MIQAGFAENIVPKAHPIELRERVVAHVDDGHTHRSTAIHFRVSIKFVNDMVKLKHKTGCLIPQMQIGSTGRGKLAPYMNWLRGYIEQHKDATLSGMALALKHQHGVEVSLWGVSCALRRMNYSHKKRRFMPKSNNAVM